MSEGKTFFRTCPACGRKFEVHLVSKTRVGEEDSVGGTPPGAEDESESDRYKPDRPAWAVLEESTPTVVIAEDFQYKYKCSHCGHEWSEVHEKVTEGSVKGYTGD